MDVTDNSRKRKNGTECILCFESVKSRIKVLGSEVIGSNGAGHGALAGLLADHTIDTLIGGGIGGGAMAALAEAGIELVEVL